MHPLGSFPKSINQDGKTSKIWTNQMWAIYCRGWFPTRFAQSKFWSQASNHRLFFHSNKFKLINPLVSCKNGKPRILPDFQSWWLPSGINDYIKNINSIYGKHLLESHQIIIQWYWNKQKFSIDLKTLNIRKLLANLNISFL